MQPGILYGIGIGPGDPELITIKAARLIRSSDVIFTVISSHVEESVSEDVVRSFAPKGRIERLVFSMSRDKNERLNQFRRNAGAIAAELNKGLNCVFATLGDTLSYSTFGYMLPMLKNSVPGLVIDIVPGVTSWSTLAAKAGTVLVENRETLRVIPSFTSDMADKLVIEPGTSTVLLKTYHSRGALTRRLRGENVDVFYGENLTRAGEFVTTNLDEIDSRDETYLSLMLVKSRDSAR